MIPVEKDCGSAMLAGQSLDSRMRDCSKVMLVCGDATEAGAFSM